MKFRNNFLLLSFSILLCSNITIAQSFEGNWYGKLETGFSKLPLILHIQKVKRNKYTTTLDSPSQKSFGTAANVVKVKRDSIQILFSSLSILYKAKLQNDSIAGKMFQMGREMKLVLTQDSLAIATPKRPQDPKTPYPYLSKEVTFTNTLDNISLSGTLTYPKEGTNFRTVVLISGSGPQDRNEEMLNHRPFLVLSDYLTKNGIAVLRYDDRGIGKSKGDFNDATTYDFKNDAQAAVNYLKTLPNVDQNHIGVIGHSEGAMIAGMLAADSNNLDFAVFLAAPGVPIKTLMLEQNKDILLSENTSQTKIDSTMNLLAPLYDSIIKDDKCDAPCISKIIQANVGDKVFKDNMMQYYGLIQMMNTKWFRAFIKIRPEDYLKNVKIPILALNGDHDIQVRGVENLNAIVRAMPNNEQLKENLYPHLNHLFQPCVSCKIDEYEEIPTTISEAVMSDIADWINKVK